MDSRGNLKVPFVTALPTAGTAGRLVRLTTDNNALYYDNGTAWGAVTAPTGSKITELTDAVSVGATDTIPIVQSLTTKEATLSVVKAYLNPKERVFLGGDVTNSNATANTLADVTGLSFTSAANVLYSFRFFIVFTAAATGTGSRWTINSAGTPSILDYRSEYSLTTTSRQINEGLNAFNSPAAASLTSAATNSNIAIIEGIIKFATQQTVIARFASEVASSAIVARSGRSYVDYEIIG